MTCSDGGLGKHAPLRILPSWDCQDGRHDVWKVRRRNRATTASAGAPIIVYDGECAICGTVITSSEPIALTPRLVNSTTVGKGWLVE